MHFSTEEEHTFPVNHDRVFIPGNLEDVTRYQRVVFSIVNTSESVTYVIL